MAVLVRAERALLAADDNLRRLDEERIREVEGVERHHGFRARKSILFCQFGLAPLGVR
jgi:hypothetical protein